MRTNINGFNTHLHHESLQGMRKHKDLPKHSIYHVHCECSAGDDAEDLKDTVCKKLIPNENEELLQKVQVVDSNDGKL